MALESFNLSRRQLLVGSGVIAAGGALTACGAGAAAPAAAPVVAGVVFNPAVDGWLAEIAKAVLANEVTKLLEGGLKAAYAKWRGPAKETIGKVLPPNGYYCTTAYTHDIPPTVLVQINATNQFSPATDHLCALVQGGSAAVVFPPWAWQALSLAINSLTSGKSGDELAHNRALAAYTLLPAGPKREGHSPQGVTSWLSYPARAGVVELDMTILPNGSREAQVRATGLPNSAGAPSQMKFTLPAKPATSG